jgi:AraC-like DNA-binding protein
MFLKIPYQLISPRIRQVLAYIDKDYDRGIELSEVASLIDIHPDYLSRRFKKEVGIGFHGYLLWIRIQKASFLLVDSVKSIKEIGYEVGFSRPEIFSKVFKRLVGCSPVAFRSSRFPTNGGPRGEVPSQVPSYHSVGSAERDAACVRELQTGLEATK